MQQLAAVGREHVDAGARCWSDLRRRDLALCSRHCRRAAQQHEHERWDPAGCHGRRMLACTTQATAMLRSAMVMCCVLRAIAAQDLADAAFARDLAAIVPKKDELDWRAIPWQSELRAALVEASRVQKPVLLWAMNGHPLAQT